MANIYPEMQKLGGAVLAVSFAAPAQVAAFLERGPLPFPVVSDPELAAYHAFNLQRTSWLAMLKPGVIWRFVKMILRGWLPRQPAQGEDVMQLGGDFILDAQQRLVFAHPSREPTDRPSAMGLLAALRAVS